MRLPYTKMNNGQPQRLAEHRSSLQCREGYVATNDAIIEQLQETRHEAAARASP